MTANQRRGVWILTAAGPIFDRRHALQMAGLVTEPGPAAAGSDIPTRSMGLRRAPRNVGLEYDGAKRRDQIDFS
jgi:hypothetical protein